MLALIITMKKTILFLCLITGTTAIYAQFQFVSTTKAPAKIQGLCDSDKLFSLFLMDQFEQNKASRASLPNNLTLTKLLNDKVKTAKEDTKLKGKLDLTVYINCQGKLVYAELTKKAKDNKLNDEIIAVISKIENWNPGIYQDQPVDSFHYYYVNLKNGIFVDRFEN